MSNLPTKMAGTKKVFQMIKSYEYSARAELSGDAEAVNPLVEVMTYHKIQEALKEQNAEISYSEMVEQMSEMDIRYKSELDAMKFGSNTDYKTPLTLDEMRYIFETVDDTHVMVQTINYSDKFDGERDFSLDGNFLVSDEFKKAVDLFDTALIYKAKNNHLPEVVMKIRMYEITGSEYYLTQKEYDYYFDTNPEYFA